MQRQQVNNRFRLRPCFVLFTPVWSFTDKETMVHRLLYSSTVEEKLRLPSKKEIHKN